MDLVLETGNATDIGRKRDENQDYFGAYEGTPHGDLWIVCDGMGGVAGGRVASTVAVEQIRKEMTSNHQVDAPTALRDAIAKANAAVYERSQQECGLRGMGTTVVALIISDGKATIAHVGDSRAYLLRRGKIQQLTKDHTLVEELVDSGSISKEEGRDHPQGHVITRSVGIRGDVDVEIDIENSELQMGDRILLCSDGLTGHISDDIIAEVVGGMNPQAASQSLVQLANEAGGDDNITVQVIDVRKTASTSWTDRLLNTRKRVRFSVVVVWFLIGGCVVGWFAYDLWKNQDMEKNVDALESQDTEKSL